jgi:carboxyl-terminal processing protease
VRLIRFGAVLALLAALAAGLYLGGHPTELPDFVRDLFVEESASLQATAAEVIEDNYAQKIPKERLQNASLRGMIEELHDRFSHYFTPRQLDLFQESIGGEFSGVGMTVLEHRRGLLVTGVYKGTPAARGGIRPGDLITAVNGKSIAGESSELATARIKGKPGTFVTLTVVRRPNHRRTVRLKRARIEIPVVDARLRTIAGKKVGVVSLASFTDGAHGQLRSVLTRLMRRGARGFVLDLRQNGGGLLEEAVLVSSLFVPDGVIVVTKGRTRPKRVLKATGGAIKREPLVVLVDRGTASAAEIVTAALSERLKAKVVGTRTFGKGVFGQLFTLPNGGAFDLTLGSYFTPEGRNLAGKGVPPDVRASDIPSTARDEALDRALRVLAGEARGASGR